MVIIVGHVNCCSFDISAVSYVGIHSRYFCVQSGYVSNDNISYLGILQEA